MPSRASCAAAVVGDHEDDVAPDLGKSNGDVLAAVLQGVPEHLAEHEHERGRALPGEPDVGELGVTSFSAPSPCTSIPRRRSISSARSADVLAVLGQLLVYRGDGEDAIDEVAERLARIDALCP